MSILITGSRGYIARSFINKYSHIYGFETFSLEHQSMDEIDFDLVDTVLHCAALVHQRQQYSYEKYYEVNVIYTQKLAKLAKRKGVKHFIFLSSVAVYGSSISLVNEDTPCSPETAYAKSKLEAEKYLLALNDEDFKVSIIRSPMVYGKKAPGNIASLIKLVKFIPLLPLGEIQNKRSFVYISNLCNLIREIVAQNKEGLFLAADDEAISTSKLCNYISKFSNKRVYLFKSTLFKSLLKKCRPPMYNKLFNSFEIDNRKTREVLKLQNPVSVEKGIENMIRGNEECYI